MALFRFQCSIAFLMGFTLIVGVELAALQSATGEWAEAVRFLTIGILVVATYRARFSTGMAGTWWFGFALLGWAYYLLGIDATRRWTSLAYYDQYSFLETLSFRILGLDVPPHEYRLADTTSKEVIRLVGQILVIQRISVLIVASFGGLLCLLLRHFRKRHDSHDSTQT